MKMTAFASPLAGNFPRLADDMLRRLVRHSLGRVTALAAHHGLPAPEVDEVALARPHAALRAWSPEWSAVRLGLARADLCREEIEWLSAQASIAAHVCGWTRGFELRRCGSRPLFLGGRVVTGERLRAEADAAAISVIDDASGRALRFSRRDGLDRVWLADAADLAPVGGEHAVVFSDGEWMRYWLDEPVERGNEPEASRRALRDAGDVLQAQLPEFYLWVSLLLREVLPLPRPDARLTASQSAPAWGGQIMLSPGSVVDTIVMLLHECSHQYFHLAMKFSPVTKSGAPEVYSALKKRNRPLDRVLLGYHAFGIVLLALTALRERDCGLDRQQLDGTWAQTAEQVRQLDASLASHVDHLEEAGAGIYAALRAELAHAGQVSA